MTGLRLLNNKSHKACLSMVLALTCLFGATLLLRPQVAAPAKAGPISVGLITDPGTPPDQGFNWLSYQGLLRAQSELGVVGTVYTSTSSDDFGPNLQQCVDDGNSLCISVGFFLADATLLKVATNAGTKFAIVDFSWDSYPPNLRGMTFASDEAGYLAGTLAGLMTESDIVGGIGGMEIPPVTAFTEGYRNGARCANFDATVMLSYTGDFDNPAHGAQVAQEMRAQGADVILVAAGVTGYGAVLTATQSGMWGIGVETDHYFTVFMSGTVAGSNRLLSSAMKRMDNAVFDTIADVVSGTFTSGTVLYDLAVDGVGLAPFHETAPSVSQAVQNELDRVRQGIIGNTIDVMSSVCSRVVVYLPVIMKNQ